MTVSECRQGFKLVNLCLLVFATPMLWHHLNLSVQTSFCVCYRKLNCNKWRSIYWCVIFLNVFFWLVTWYELVIALLDVVRLLWYKVRCNYFIPAIWRVDLRFCRWNVEMLKFEEIYKCNVIHLPLASSSSTAKVTSRIIWSSYNDSSIYLHYDSYSNL